MISWAWPNRAAGERAYGVPGVEVRRGRHPRPANSSSVQLSARARLQRVEESSSAPCCGSVAMLCAVVPCCRRIQSFRVCLSVRRCRVECCDLNATRMFNICILRPRGSCPDLGFGGGTAPWGPISSRHGGRVLVLPEAANPAPLQFYARPCKKRLGLAPPGKLLQRWGSRRHSRKKLLLDQHLAFCKAI